MKIEFNQNNGILEVTLEGRLDTTTAPELDRFFGEHLEGNRAVTIHCEKLVYVSSAGLRVLLSTHKKTHGALKLTGVCELVMEVFEMTGLADILTIE